MKIEDLLRRVVKENASDGFISAHAAPSIKVDGQLLPVSDHKLSEEDARVLVLSVMSDEQQLEFLDRTASFGVPSHEIPDRSMSGYLASTLRQT